MNSFVFVLKSKKELQRIALAFNVENCLKYSRQRLVLELNNLESKCDCCELIYSCSCIFVCLNNYKICKMCLTNNSGNNTSLLQLKCNGCNNTISADKIGDVCEDGQIFCIQCEDGEY